MYQELGGCDLAHLCPELASEMGRHGPLDSLSCPSSEGLPLGALKALPVLGVSGSCLPMETGHEHTPEKQLARVRVGKDAGGTVAHPGLPGCPGPRASLPSSAQGTKPAIVMEEVRDLMTKWPGKKMLEATEGLVAPE